MVAFSQGALYAVSMNGKDICLLDGFSSAVELPALRGSAEPDSPGAMQNILALFSDYRMNRKNMYSDHRGGDGLF